MADLVIDWTRCDGHGLCAAVLPGVVGRDEWGYPLITGPVQDVRAARRAAALCPALALRVETATRK